jgi:hypothetical protein
MGRPAQPKLSYLLLLVAAVVGLLGVPSVHARPERQSVQNRALLLPALTLPPSTKALDEVAARRQALRDEGVARQVDAVLREAVQDLGLLLEVETLRPESYAEELALPRLAPNRWVISPRVRTVEGRVELRIVAVAPNTEVVVSSASRMHPHQLEVRAMVLLRDLVLPRRGSGPTESRGVPSPPSSPKARPAKSCGRAVLAANGTVLGGYVGYSLQRASGSDDARLLYPLMALGSGVGLGGSMIAAHEWNVGVGDAWYLSAGTWWPLFSGILLADAYRVEPDTDRYVYGMIGSMAGLSLGTLAIAMRPATEGDALVTHSGGAMGMLLGGLTQLTYRGDSEVVPSRGMGFGAGIGVVAAGALATQVDISATRVLLVDLGASLGALTGAAVAAPVLIVDAPDSKNRTRVWLASVAGGVLVGGAIAVWITREPSDPEQPSGGGLGSAQPFIAPIGETCDEGGKCEPSLGVGLAGTW